MTYLSASQPETNEGNSALDTRKLRDVLSCFATGVAVATTVGKAGMPVGLTVNSFNSVSMDPPLILWSVSLSAPSFTAFSSHDAFAINMLSTQQADLCHRFSRPSADKFSGVRWTPGLDGVPLLDEALASLECRVWRRYEGGDHEIILGRVVDLRSSNKPPLVYHRGRIVNLASHHEFGASMAEPRSC
jgi:flavin reductase (DIM6/NTAB) family NADH-FMN oxidoreductase RutF